MKGNFQALHVCGVIYNVEKFQNCTWCSNYETIFGKPDSHKEKTDFKGNFHNFSKINFIFGKTYCTRNKMDFNCNFQKFLKNQAVFGLKRNFQNLQIKVSSIKWKSFKNPRSAIFKHLSSLQCRKWQYCFAPNLQKNMKR